jgi:hypothetical protein
VSRWGIPRLGQLLEVVELLHGCVAVVGGVAEIYHNIKHAREEEEEDDCAHPGLQLAHKHKAGEEREHVDHSGCFCAPRWCCLVCGIGIGQGAFFGSEEPEEEEAPDADT